LLFFPYKPEDLKRIRLKKNIQDRKKKIQEKKSKKNFIVFNNFSSCIIEHIIFNIITTIITEIPNYSEKVQKTKRNIPLFVLSFSKSSGKIQIFSAKADFLGLVLLRR